MEARGAPVGSLDPRGWFGLKIETLAGKHSLIELVMASNECRGAVPIVLFDRNVVGNLKSLMLQVCCVVGVLPRHRHHHRPYQVPRSWLTYPTLHALGQQAQRRAARCVEHDASAARARPVE